MIAMIVGLETVEEYEQRAKSANPYNEDFIIRCREYALKYASFNSSYGAFVLQDLGRALPVQYHSRVFEGITSFRPEHFEYEAIVSEAPAESESSEEVEFLESEFLEADEVYEVIEELPESLALPEGLAYDIGKIKGEILKISESYFYIGATLFDIRSNKDFGGYKNIYELCLGELGLKRSLVKNLISCFEKYRAAEKYQFSLEWRGYSFSQLVEMLPLEKEFIRENIEPSMSVREIKDLKRSEKENGQTSGQKLPAAKGYKFLDAMELEELYNLRSLIDDKIAIKEPAPSHLRVV